MNALQARKTRPEDPSGVHLPDPIVLRADALDPEHEVLMADSVGLALQIVLDTFSFVRRGAGEVARTALASAQPAAVGIPALVIGPRELSL